MSIITVQKQLHLFLYRPAPTANTVYTSDIRGRVRKIESCMKTCGLTGPKMYSLAN